MFLVKKDQILFWGPLDPMVDRGLSEVWCLKENEDAILKRTERVRVKTMGGQKVVDRKTEEQVDMLGLIINHFLSSILIVIG